MQPITPNAYASNHTPRPSVLVCEADRGRGSLLADVIATHCAGMDAPIIDPRDADALAAHAPLASGAVCVCGPTDATRFDTLGRIAQTHAALPTLVLAPADQPKLADEALRIGAADVLMTAPSYLEHVPLAVRKMLRAANLRRAEQGYQVSLLRELRDLRAEHRTLAASVDRLELLAATDPLTGLANRRTIDARLAELLSAANRHDLPLSVLAVDVDGLKAVNDTLGHAAGDDILEIVADVLHGASRVSDVVGRIGGDEFVVILPHTDAQRAMVVAERAIRAFALRVEGVRERIRKARAVERGVVQVVGRGLPRHGAALPGLSMGVAAREHGVKTPADGLLASADEALYRAKVGGRGRAAASGVRVVVRPTERAAA